MAVFLAAGAVCLAVAHAVDVGLVAELCLLSLLVGGAVRKLFPTKSVVSPIAQVAAEWIVVRTPVVQVVVVLREIKRPPAPAVPVRGCASLSVNSNRGMT